MAPWSNQGDSFPRGSIQSQHNGGRPARPSAAHKNPTRNSGLDVMDGPQLHADSSSSESDLHPSRPRRPALHTRSISHPFPSLFSTKKKKAGRAANRHSDSDSADEVADMSNFATKNQQRAPNNQGAASGSQEFTTGNCMTCGSFVRWPRDLSIFKCTICLTINDLQPSTLDPRRDGTPVPSQTAGGDLPTSPLRAVTASSTRPISVEHTRGIIKQCLETFLRNAVPAAPSSTEPTESPPAASLLHPPGGEPGTTTQPRNVSQSECLAPAGPASGQIPLALGEPGLHPNLLRRSSPISRSYSTSYPERRPVLQDLAPRENSPQPTQKPKGVDPDSRRIFRALEDYVANSITFYSLSVSFISTSRPTPVVRHASEPHRRRLPEHRRETQHDDYPIADLDAKLLLLGDFAENGSWWTGGQDDFAAVRSASHRNEDSPSTLSARSPYIDWEEVDDWYTAVANAGQTWRSIYEDMRSSRLCASVPDSQLHYVEDRILAAQDHVQKVLLRATETLLKRPGRPITEPTELRFLLITLANPLLHASNKPFSGYFKNQTAEARQHTRDTPRGSGPVAGRHSGIIKRVLGILSNSSNSCHRQLIYWFAKYFSRQQYIETKDLVSGFLAYRLIRQNEKKLGPRVDVIEGLIPSMSAGRSPASLHAALGHSARPPKKSIDTQKKITYCEDWQIKAAARVMALIFAANNLEQTGRRHSGVTQPDNIGAGANELVQARSQILPTSDFYTTLLDDFDLVADFEAWEHRRVKFSFCQYPFLLSVWAKIQILEHDARRQMETRARDAFFDSIMTHRDVDPYLILNVRRDCLVEDSLKAVSEVIGSGGEDIKKGLKIIFKGEEGVDAGGLRKEWFLLLVREVFNPDHGMFVYDEDSHYCYFNPNAFETSDQFFLVGVVFGLAIYNSTILDVAFPPFAFRKLLSAALPPAAGPGSAQTRISMNYTLEDLAEYRPSLARGLRQLLEYDGDVESTFMLDFVIETDKYGARERIPLCAGGERRPVTNANRREYVDLYVRYLLDTAVARQFEPFKRGFFTVCGGNALSLFRPEEIELLVRGSDEALDIGSLRIAAVYDNWGGGRDGRGAEAELPVRWFWQSFEGASPADQRKLLLFITGSDRIPAMGAASLSIRISCLGDDCDRYPTARTCFNTLALWRYRSRERLEAMLWRAVHESEGFGLK